MNSKIGHNEKCHCGSNQKYKKCCRILDEKEKSISVFSEFSEIKDPRDNRGKRYKLIDLFIMTIYGILNGYDDFNNIADFLKVNASYFKNLLLIEKTPSHDCLSDLFAVIDSDEFMGIFVKWIREIVHINTGAVIALDGKAVKSARDKINGGNTPYILSAFLSEVGVSIGQIGVNEKSNEVKFIPELLKLIEIKGCYITIDALGTQEEVARKIVELKGHYILKVKKNQKTLMNNIATFFENNAATSDDIAFLYSEIEQKHGREEYREYYVSHDISCITNKKKWDTVEAIGMVRVHKWINMNIEITDHYYIMDTKIDIRKFSKATRSHWNIECGLHWRLDVILNEDHSRNRIGNSIDNLSAVRKLVFNLVKLDSSLGNISFEKKLTRYRYDFSNIENLIFNVIPSISA